MSNPIPKEVKAIQINVALGARQRVDILVDSRVTRDLCSQSSEHHSEGLTSIHPALIELVSQLGDKLCEALQARAPAITVQVDGVEILPDSEGE